MQVCPHQPPLLFPSTDGRVAQAAFHLRSGGEGKSKRSSAKTSKGRQLMTCAKRPFRPEKIEKTRYKRRFVHYLLECFVAEPSSFRSESRDDFEAYFIYHTHRMIPIRSGYSLLITFVKFKNENQYLKENQSQYSFQVESAF